MSIARHHAEWLSLVEVSGPFLSMPVLMEAFPQGLEAHDPDHHRLLRLAHDEWEAKPNNPAIHNAWVRFVLRKTLDYAPEALLEGQAIPQTLHAEVAEQHEILKPDLVLMERITNHRVTENTEKDTEENKTDNSLSSSVSSSVPSVTLWLASSTRPRLLIQMYPASQDLAKPVPGLPWKASPDTRMTELLHKTGVRLGLVTNGERWMLVDAPRGETTGYASWYATFWLEEPITLRAFRSLLGLHRFFGVDEKDTLEKLLEKSAANQQEVTDQLGYQVRKAVEVLIQSLDRADQDHGRGLLQGVSEAELYEASLTVMMRLVFLFCAEERELLLLGDPLYNQNYAVSTIREQLRATADQFGEEVLERRHDAWCRLLVTFRAVYGGVWHDNMKLPAYGGRLFDPDRFPWLEGKTRTNHRVTEGTEKDTEKNTKDYLISSAVSSSVPSVTLWLDDFLPLVNNRTVLHLLEALQLLQVKVPGGGPAEARRLSFRALDIEQIGHVYEGLLDHTAKRAGESYLGLAGTREKEPEIALAKLEELTTESQRTQRKTQESKEFLKYLKEVTGRSESALKKALSSSLGALCDSVVSSRFRVACQGDEALWKRVQPFAGLVRLDTFGYPVVIPKGSVFVTAGTDRRSSGTHYTPRCLTEPIVQYTLEPLVYIGPAEGLPKNQWKLRSAKEILDLKICDMACGSAAFLVQACRYLSERLLEAWEKETNHRVTENTEKDTEENKTNKSHSSSAPSVPLWLDSDNDAERITLARRIIAQRCLYGVDKNPLAVEMAKLSLWLLTLAKDMPFEFLDHAIRCGDSLIGVHDFTQLERLHLDADAAHAKVYQDMIRRRIDAAIGLRRKIEEMPAATVEDIKAQEALLRQAEQEMDRLRCGADLLVAEAFGADLRAWSTVTVFEENSDLQDYQKEADRALRGQARFHWPLEFPEVFANHRVTENTEKDTEENKSNNFPSSVSSSVPSVTLWLGGFDALVCNPPFMGGQKITGNLGNAYREYLVKWLAGGQRGSADLCAYFFLRGAQLLREGGQLGFLATNTIAQGDTREVGLEQLTAEDCIIPRAVPSRPWPGTASLEVAHVWVRKGAWSGPFVLDDKPANGITAFLTPPGTVSGNPYRLKANEDKSFQGSIVLGMGFVLEPEEAQRLIDKDARNKDVLFPYLNGEDLNSRPDQSPSRWVINFFDWPIDKAIQYPDCFRIIEEKIKPERMKNKRKERREKWWHYAEKCPALYRTIAGMERVLVCAQTSRMWEPDFAPLGIVYSHTVVIFPLSTFADFGKMQASFHEFWRLEYGPSLRTDARYTPSDCFETFPFPSCSVSSSVSSVTLWLDHLESIGERYHSHRRQIMLARQEGLTRTYNRFHDPDESSGDIVQLRQLHVEMDHAVAVAYGWTELDLGHGFHQTKQGLRYTISEAARREVLARLLTLNHERYADEVKQGLHEKKKPRNTRKTRKKAEDGGMFE